MTCLMNSSARLNTAMAICFKTVDVIDSANFTSVGMIMTNLPLPSEMWDELVGE